MKLVDECTEIDEEVKPAIINLAENKNSKKCSSCTVYNVVFWIFFTISIGGIRAHFVYFYWYFKKCAPHVNFNARTQTDIY